MMLEKIDVNVEVESILDVAERDSVLQGLPPFTPEFRDELRSLATITLLNAAR